MAFVKAVRHQVKVKIALIGPSGSGKTYTALRLARGIAGQEGKIALLDTENDRGLYYANEFDYDHDRLSAPYTPERYIQKIDEAIQAGYDVLILDSMTHEWSGIGGCLDMIEKMSGSNKYTKWAKVTPRHNAFIEKILQSPIHIITTIRGKDQYVLEQDEQGKQVPKKIGLGGIQRDGIEYEYTLTFLIDQNNHVATTQKDNTHIFENRFEILTEDHGKMLLEWAEGGVVAPVKENNHDTQGNIKPHVIITEKNAKMINDLLEVKDSEVKKLRSDKAKSFLRKVKVDRIRNLADPQARSLIKLLEAIPDLRNEKPINVAI